MYICRFSFGDNLAVTKDIEHFVRGRYPEISDEVMQGKDNRRSIVSIAHCLVNVSLMGNMYTRAGILC